jgi:hypothetical protein
MLRIVLLLFLLISLNSEACCSAGQLRIFPLGMMQNKPICAVFETSRACSDDGMGADNEIYWFGRMTLQFLEKDSLRLFKALDTFEFVECICKYDEIENNSQYREIMQRYLDSAYLVASNEKGFTPFTGILYAADSIAIKEQFKILTDSTALWKKHEIDLGKNESISCMIMNEIKEVRIYQSGNYELLIASVGCPTQQFLNEKSIKKNKESFQKNKNGAMTYIPIDWHGYTIDLYQLDKGK